MKRSYVYLFLFFLLMLLFTAGCADGSRESAAKISSPRNRLIPVAGTWEVAGVIENGALKLEELPEPWSGKSLQFSEDYALLGDNLLEKPRYKIKRVNKEEFLLYGHKSLPKELDTTDKELDIITVTDEDKFLCEIIRVGSAALILEIDNHSLYLKKISDQVSRRADLKYREITGNFDLGAAHGEEPPKTGVLMGFCSPSSGSHKKADQAYNYRTLWIAATDKQLHPILHTQGILFPRRSGFWRMEDFLIAHPVATGEKKAKKTRSVEPVKKEERAGSITRRICYVGNDYVSIESKDTATAESTLQVLPIDSLPGIKAVKIADLSGEAGAAAMEEGKRKAIEELEANGGSLVEEQEQDDSFGLERKMGHWFFKGRINYRKDDKTRFIDYSINVIPPAELIFYDELSVPWTAVKDRVPEAVDVFTSPNRDIALVITRTELAVFGISNGRLENQPLGKVALKAGETVVMAEWAIGRYVEGWENSFVDNDK
jgi:hypothetical protein